MVFFFVGGGREGRGRGGGRGWTRIQRGMLGLIGVSVGILGLMGCGLSFVECS